MLVSIITPLYNSSKYISNTIESVIRQTYTNWEMLIVDDCSKDDSALIVEDYVKKDSRILLFTLNENSGAAIARNKGIELAKGEYIAFLDSDDIWQPEKLEEQLQTMVENNCSFSHTSYELFNENFESLGLRTTCNKVITYRELINYNWIGTSSVIYNAENLGKHYMPNLRNRQDWALWLALIKVAGSALFISKPLTNYTVRSGSISSNKTRLIKYHWLIYRQVEGFNVFKSITLLIGNIYYHLKKDKFIKH